MAKAAHNKKLLVGALFAVSAGAVISCGGGGGGTTTTATNTVENATNATENATNVPRFAEPKAGWSDNKVVGPYVVRKATVQSNGQNIDFNDPARTIGNNRNSVVVDGILYAFDNDASGNARVVAVNTANGESVTVTVNTPTDPNGNRLASFNNNPVIWTNGQIALIQGTNNNGNAQLFLATFNGNTVTFYPLVDNNNNAIAPNNPVVEGEVNGYVALVNRNQIYMVSETPTQANNNEYIVAYSNTDNANLPTVTGGAADTIPNLIAINGEAYRFINASTVWVIAQDTTNSDIDLVYAEFDFTNRQWHIVAAAAINNHNGGNQVTPSVLADVDIDKNGTTDVINATDIQPVDTNNNIPTTVIKAANATEVEAYVTIASNSSDFNNDTNPDSAAVIIRVNREETNQLRLSSYGVLAFQLGNSSRAADNIEYVREIPVPNKDAEYVIVADTTDNNTAATYVEKQSDGSYKITNRDQYYVTTDPVYAQISHLLSSVANYTTLNNVTTTGTNDGFAVVYGFVNNNTTLDAEVIYIDNSRLKLSQNLQSLVNNLGINGVNEITNRTEAVTGVFVADDNNRQIDTLKWDITNGWQVEARGSYGTDPENNQNINTVNTNGLIALDATRVIANLQDAAGNNKYWLFEESGSSLVRSNLGIRANPANGFDDIATGGNTVISLNGTEVDVYRANTDLNQWGNVRVYYNFGTAPAAISAVNIDGEHVYVLATHTATPATTYYADVDVADNTDAVVVSHLLEGLNIPFVRFSGSGKIAYAIDNTNNVYVIDLSQGAENANISAVTSPGFSIADAAIANDGSAVYVVGSNVIAKVDRNGGLSVSDAQYIPVEEGLSNQTTITAVMDRVAVSGDYVIVGAHIYYRLSGSDVSKAYIRVFNATDLKPVSNWIEIATDSGNNPEAAIVDIKTYNNIVYVHYETAVNQANTFAIVDISNPAEPQVVSNVSALANLAGFSISQRFAYGQDSNNNTLIEKFGLDNPANPTTNPRVNIAFIGNGANTFITQTAYGEYAFLLNGNNTQEVEIYNMTNPTAPVYVGDILLPFNGLQIRTVSLPTRVNTVATVTEGSVDIDDMDNSTYAVVGTNNGVYIVDLNPMTR
jgi:hypothetical protein